MDKILDLILKDTFTSAQLKRRLLGLKKYYSQHLFEEGAKDSPDIFAVSDDLQWFQSIRDILTTKLNQSNYNDFITDLEKKSHDLTTLTVFLPIDPSEADLRWIGSEVRDRYNPHLMLDVRYDPDLIAGCAFAIGGIYKDYSLKEKLPQIREVLTKSLQELKVR